MMSAAQQIDVARLQELCDQYDRGECLAGEPHIELEDVASALQELIERRAAQAAPAKPVDARSVRAEAGELLLAFAEACIDHGLMELVDGATSAEKAEALFESRSAANAFNEFLDVHLSATVETVIDTKTPQSDFVALVHVDGDFVDVATNQEQQKLLLTKHRARLYLHPPPEVPAAPPHRYLVEQSDGTMVHKPRSEIRDDDMVVFDGPDAYAEAEAAKQRLDDLLAAWQAVREPLSEWEISDIYQAWDNLPCAASMADFARMIEAKHGIGVKP